jgi:hypothetical protein
MFHAGSGDETKLPRHETILRRGENIPKPVMDTKAPTKFTGQTPDDRGLVMIKTFSAVAVAALIAAALTVLPGFTPQVAASVPQALTKADRLDIRLVGADCSQQAWPNFEASCLRHAGTRATIRQARLVTADRTP